MMIKNNICPIGNTLDLFNRKWIFCILSNIFRGMTHFSEFKNANPTISNHILAQTLKYMEENDLIEKTVCDEYGNVTQYGLTEKGRKTNRILYDITVFYFDELNYVDYSDDEIAEILKEYREAYEIE